MSVKIEYGKFIKDIKMGRVNKKIKKIINPVGTAFMTDALRLVKQRSPVDSGEYRNAWELEPMIPLPGEFFAFKLVNKKPYAIVMETGSTPGQKPWPNTGPKTVKKSGKIWSSQMPEPVGGKAISQTRLNLFSSQITKTIKRYIG